MARGAIVCILLATAALAGCVGGDDPVDPTNATAPNGTQASPSDPTDGGEASPGSRQADRGPVESPAWQVGDWWRYRVDHRLGPTTNVTLAVAETSQSTYRLGWVEPMPALASVLYHLPPAGEISRPNLGWWWHDETVHLVEFPLEDGKTWTASLGDAELTYTASAVQGTDDARAVAIEGTNETGARVIDATYDADVGFFTHVARFFDADGSPSPAVELVDHGSLADLPGNGTVHVPAMTDLLDRSLVGPDPATGRPPAGEPAGTFQVEEGTDRLVLGAFLGGAQGIYEASWQPPTGGPEVMVDTNGPGDDDVALFTTYPEDPAGTWGYEATAGGPGFVFLEAVGVTLDTVYLASPAR